MTRRGSVIVVTGPSGVGKNTLIQAVRRRVPGLAHLVSATTRPPRDSETDGVEYFFLSDDEFDRRVTEGDFVEHAEYSGHKYGTLRSEIEGRTAAGESVILDIEVQGARQIRKSLPATTQVFISPPSFESLRARLMKRGADDPAEAERRLAIAKEELEARHEFDHEIVNDQLERAVMELTTIVCQATGVTEA